MTDIATQPYTPSEARRRVGELLRQDLMIARSAAVLQASRREIATELGELRKVARYESS